MNNKIAAAVMALLMSAGLAATARAAGDTMLDSAQTLVNGKPYAAKTKLADGDILAFNGPGFVKINGVTIDFTGTATATYKNGVMTFDSTSQPFSVNGKPVDISLGYVLVVDAVKGGDTVGQGASGKSINAATDAYEDGAPLSTYDAMIFNIVGQWNSAISPAQGVTLQVSPSAP